MHASDVDEGHTRDRGAVARRPLRRADARAARQGPELDRVAALAHGADGRRRGQPRGARRRGRYSTTRGRAGCERRAPRHRHRDDRGRGRRPHGARRHPSGRAGVPLRRGRAHPRGRSPAASGGVGRSRRRRGHHCARPGTARFAATSPTSWRPDSTRGRATRARISSAARRSATTARTSAKRSPSAASAASGSGFDPRPRGSHRSPAPMRGGPWYDRAAPGLRSKRRRHACCRAGMNVATLLVLALMSSDADAAAGEAQDRARTKEVVVGLGAEPRTLLGVTIVDWTTNNMLEHIYDRLLDRDAKTLQAEAHARHELEDRERHHVGVRAAAGREVPQRRAVHRRSP